MKVNGKILKQSLMEYAGEMVQLRRSKEATDAMFKVAFLTAEDLERLACIINVFAAGKHPMDMTPVEFNEYLGAVS